MELEGTFVMTPNATWNFLGHSLLTLWANLPYIKETGLFTYLFFFCKASGECVFWLIWKSQGKLGSRSSQTLGSCREKNQGLLLKTGKKQFGYRLHPWTRDHNIEGSPSADFSRFWFMSQVGEEQLHHQNQTRTVHVDKCGGGRPRSWKPEVCMWMIITVTNKFCPIPLKTQQDVLQMYTELLYLLTWIPERAQTSLSQDILLIKGVGTNIYTPGMAAE